MRPPSCRSLAHRQHALCLLRSRGIAQPRYRTFCCSEYSKATRSPCWIKKSGLGGKTSLHRRFRRHLGGGFGKSRWRRFSPRWWTCSGVVIHCGSTYILSARSKKFQRTKLDKRSCWAESISQSPERLAEEWPRTAKVISYALAIKRTSTKPNSREGIGKLRSSKPEKLLRLFPLGESRS